MDIELERRLAKEAADGSAKSKLKVIIDYLLKRKMADRDPYIDNEYVVQYIEQHVPELVLKDDPMKRRLSDKSFYESLRNAKKELAQELKDKNGFRLRGNSFAYPLEGADDVIGRISERKKSVRKNKLNQIMAYSRGLFPSMWENAFSDFVYRIADEELPKFPKVIDFGANPNLENANYLPQLFDAIVGRQVLKMAYSPHYSYTTIIIFHPYYLKHYNNRWFVIGFSVGENGDAYDNDVRALDRINDLQECGDVVYRNPQVDYDIFFDDVIGVTHLKGMEESEIVIKTLDDYVHQRVKTKPPHSSLKEKMAFGVSGENCGLLSIKVRPNPELKALLLSYGASIRVVQPEWYAQEMAEEIKKMAENYNQ